MSMTSDVPRVVAMVVGEELGQWYFSHGMLNELFKEAEAPGEPPEGNCQSKCQKWLLRCNATKGVDALRVLGRVLEDFMTPELEVGRGWNASGGDREASRARITSVLESQGLRYVAGRVASLTRSGAEKLLEDAIRRRDMDSVEEEFRRTLERVESEPREALTAACALLESLFKCYIEDHGLEKPSKQDVKGLWKAVRGELGLDPSSVEDDDVSRILRGLVSIVDGLGALRTHAGSAHGRGRTSYRLTPRHARLAANAAHTLALCVLETWNDREAQSATAASQP